MFSFSLDVKSSDSKDSVDEKTIFDSLSRLIQSQNALIKVINSTVGFNRDWEFMLKSLADPKNVRPLKKIDEKWDRQCVLNPCTWQYEKRQVGIRGVSKDTVYIKKTSTSLLPAHGKMIFFGISYAVGMLFDINNCRISDKYIFPTNATTNSYWWVGAENPNKEHAIKAISLSDLRARQTAESKVCEWNEILARPSKKSLVALFAPRYMVTDRVNAIHKKFLVMEKLGVDLPLLIITPSYGASLYSFEAQIKDMVDVLENKNLVVANQFIQDLFKLPCFLNMMKYVGALVQHEKRIPGLSFDAISGNNVLHSALLTNSFNEKFANVIVNLQSFCSLICGRNNYGKTPIQLAIDKNIALPSLIAFAIKFPRKMDPTSASLLLVDALKKRQINVAKSLLNSRLQFSMLNRFECTGEDSLFNLAVRANDFALLFNLLGRGLNVTLELNEVSEFLNKQLVFGATGCKEILKAMNLTSNLMLQKEIIFYLIKTNQDAAKIYVESISDTNVSDLDEKGDTLIERVSFEEKPNVSLINILITKGARFDFKVEYSPITSFIQTKNYPVLEMLISNHLKILPATEKLEIFNLFLQKKQRDSINLFKLKDPGFIGRIIASGYALNSALKFGPYDAKKVDEINWLLEVGYQFTYKQSFKVLFQSEYFAGINFVLSAIEIAKAELIKICEEALECNNLALCKLVLSRVNFRFSDNDLIYRALNQATPNIEIIKAIGFAPLSSQKMSVFDYSFSLLDPQVFGFFLDYCGDKLTESRIESFITATLKINKQDNLLQLLRLYKNNRASSLDLKTDSSDDLFKVKADFLNEIFKVKLPVSCVEKLCADDVTLNYFIDNFVKFVNINVLEAVLLQLLNKPNEKRVQAIIQARPQANVNQQDEKSGNSALHYALLEPVLNLGLIRALYSASADVGLPNQNGITPLQLIFDFSDPMFKVVIGVWLEELLEQDAQDILVGLIKREKLNLIQWFLDSLAVSTLKSMKAYEHLAVDSAFELALNKKYYNVDYIKALLKFGLKISTSVNDFLAYGGNETLNFLMQVLVERKDVNSLSIILKRDISVFSGKVLKEVLQFSIENNIFAISEIFLKKIELLKIIYKGRLVELWDHTLKQKNAAVLYFENLLTAGVKPNFAVAMNNIMALMALFNCRKDMLTLGARINVLPKLIQYDVKYLIFISELTDEKLTAMEKVTFAKDILQKTIEMALTVKQAFGILVQFEALGKPLLFFSAKELTSVFNPTWRNQAVVKEWVEVIDSLKQRIIKLAATECPPLDQGILEFFNRKTSLASGLFGGADLAKKYAALCQPVVALTAASAHQSVQMCVSAKYLDMKKQ